MLYILGLFQRKEIATYQANKGNAHLHQRPARNYANAETD